MRPFLLLLVGLLVALSAVPGRAAPAERRVAFVVGNSNYENFPALQNPRNDAQDMIATLKSLGFDVHGGTDLTRQAFRDELRQFARGAQGADAALIFYAGHGLQYRGRNYIVPVDAKLQDEFDLDYETIRVDDIVDELIRADGAKILILDACRNLPLPSKSSREAFSSAGLAKLGGRGLIVAYATQANAVAYDGAGRNSIFTGAFLKAVQEPGLDVPQLFQRVSITVDKQTGGRQTPELSLSYPGQFFFNKGETDREAWTRVRGSSDPDALRGFITRFPSSFLIDDANEAIARIEEERRRQGRVVATREAVPTPPAAVPALPDPAAAQKTKDDADSLAWQALQAEQTRRAEARRRVDAERAAAEAQDKARVAAADAQERARLAAAEAQEKARVAAAEAQEKQRRATAEAQEKARIAAEARKADEDRQRAQDQAAAEARERGRQAEAEKKRVAEEARAAEQTRIAEEVRQRKVAEDAARAAEVEKRRVADAERKRLAEEKKAEGVRLAEEARLKKLADAQAKAEAAERQRLAEAEAKRIAAEGRAAEQARIAEETRQRQAAEDRTRAEAAETKRLAEIERGRVAAEGRAAEMARRAEEEDRQRRIIEAARQRQIADAAQADADRQARQQLAAEAARAKDAELAAARERDRLAWLELEDQQKRRAQEQSGRVGAAGSVTGSQTVAAMNGATTNPGESGQSRAAEPGTGAPPTVLASNDAVQPAIVARKPDAVAPPAEPDYATLVRDTETELARIGCLAEGPSGGWSGGARAALARFARKAKLGAVPKEPTSEILDNLKGRPDGFCTVACGRGEQAEGDRCVAVAPPKEKQRPVVERKAPRPRAVAEERERPEPARVTARPRPAPVPQAPVSTAAAGPKPAARPMLGVGF